MSPADHNMQPLPARAAICDPIWDRLCLEARRALRGDSLMHSFIKAHILDHDSLESAIAHRLGTLLDAPLVPGAEITALFAEAARTVCELPECIRSDICAVLDRDPACRHLAQPLLYFKGFHALMMHRLSHWLWHDGRQELALYLQSRGSEVFQVDIHPQVVMGRGIFIDHATGIVIGQTARIGDNVSIMQDVTLGGTGNERDDRHPKIGDCVLLGAGARVLGNIRVGRCARIAAGSVVLREVPEKVTVAGVPAKKVGKAGCAEPGRTMNQILAQECE